MCVLDTSIFRYRFILPTRTDIPNLLIYKVKRLNYNVRVRGFRSFKNQEFTGVND